MHMLACMLAASKHIALERRTKVKRRIIFFLSILILSAALSGSALAFDDGLPTLNIPIQRTESHRQGKAKLDEKEIKAFVDELVAKQVISRESGDKLLAYFDQKHEERKAERERVKSMTEEERKAYFEERKARRDADGPFAELVKDKTLTKAQADAIAKALREYKKK